MESQIQQKRVNRTGTDGTGIKPKKMWTATKKENGLSRLCGGFVLRTQTDPGQVFVKFLVLILFLEESDLNLKWSLNSLTLLV